MLKNQDRWQYSGSAVDQGNSGRSCSRVGSFPSLGSSCKRNRMYPKGSSLLRLAVSITLKHRALASAPLSVSQNKKFLLAITNGLTVRSATLFVSSSLPSSRTASNCFLWCSEYVCAFCRFECINRREFAICTEKTCHSIGDFPPPRRPPFHQKALPAIPPTELGDTNLLLRVLEYCTAVTFFPKAQCATTACGFQHPSCGTFR